MVSVAWCDEHAAVRAGLATMLAHFPSLSLVGSAADERALTALLDAVHPDVVVLDLAQTGARAFSHIGRLRQHAPTLRIVDYSADDVDELAVAAFFAGVDAVVSKRDTPDALLDAIQHAASGHRTPATLAPRRLTDAAARLDPADYAILSLRLAGESIAAIARMLGLSEPAATNRAAQIFTRLGPPASATGGSRC